LKSNSSLWRKDTLSWARPNFEAYALGLPPSRLQPSNEGRSSRASPWLKHYYTNYRHTVVISCQVSTIHFLIEWLFYFEKNTCWKINILKYSLFSFKIDNILVNLLI
jgi:hypothetical protein